MIGAVGGAQRPLPLPLPLRELTDARRLEPLIALLEAAARREDVVQLLGTSPAAALLDGLAEKARAVADLVLQGIPAPEPVVVQATAARLPQAVADVLADQLFHVANEPLPSSLDASIRVLSAGSPLVAAYLERAARYLIVCRLVSAGRTDLDTLVGALKHAAGTAEAISGERTEEELPEVKLLSAGTTEPEEAPESPFVEQRVDVATTADEATRAAAAAIDEALARPLVLLDDELPEIALPEGEATAGAEPAEATVLEPDAEQSAMAADDGADAAELPPAEGEKAPAPAPEAALEGARPSWRALPQLVTASYHVVPVAVALEQLRDGAQWIAAPSFPADADAVLGGATAGLATRDREALRELGDRTARETPALARAIAALRLPEPWSAELLGALAPAASRPSELRLSEQVRVLSALTLLRESRDAAPMPTADDGLRERLSDEVVKPLPPDVRALLDAMALDPGARPMLGRAVRYVLATRAMNAARSDGAPPSTLDERLGEDLPSLGAIDRAMLRALAATELAFRKLERPPESRRRKAARNAPGDIEIPAYSAAVEGEGTIVHGELRLLDMAFADRPLRERATDAVNRARAGDDRLTIVLAAALICLIWVLFR